MHIPWGFGPAKIQIGNIEFKKKIHRKFKLKMNARWLPMER
jgi:hypothetical protein